MRQAIRTVGLTAVFGAVLAATSAAQQTQACSEGQIETATLGIEDLDCNCVFHIRLSSDSGIARRVWDFRSEPVVGRIVQGSPAAGQIRAGDVITAIDGYLITTREGGRRLGEIVPGTSVTLRVRRDGREFDVRLTPEAQCTRINVLRVGEPIVGEVTLAPAPRVRPAEVVPRPVAEPRAAVAAPRPTAAPVRGIPVPRPWPSTPALGFSVRCSDCLLQRTADDETATWSFDELPVIDRVEPRSPADEAGLRAGDVLMLIDGEPLTSVEGGRRFSVVEAGERITLAFRRGGVEHTATLTAREGTSWSVEPPATHGVPVPQPRAQHLQPDITRFTGSLGDAVIQVTGGRVTVTRTDDEIVIQSSDITVRISRSGGNE